jgi:hypothetical protein
MDAYEILQDYFSGRYSADDTVLRFNAFSGNTQGRAWLAYNVRQSDPSITSPPSFWRDAVPAEQDEQDLDRLVAEEESGIPVDRQWSERPSQQPTPGGAFGGAVLERQRRLDERAQAAQRRRDEEAARRRRDEEAAAAADDGMDDGIGVGEVIDTPEMTEFERELDEALTVTPTVTPSRTENIFDPEYFRDPAHRDLAKGLYMQHLGISDVGQSRYQKWLMDQWLTPYTEFMLRGQELLGGLEGGIDMDFRDYLAQREGPMSRLQGDFMGAILDMDPEEQVGLFDFLGGETGAVAQRVYQGGLRDQVPGWVAQARAARAFDPNVITSFNISDAALDAENLTSFLSYLRGRYNPDSQPSTTNPMMLPGSPVIASDRVPFAGDVEGVVGPPGWPRPWESLSPAEKRGHTLLQQQYDLAGAGAVPPGFTAGDLVEYEGPQQDLFGDPNFPSWAAARAHLAEMQGF